VSDIEPNPIPTPPAATALTTVTLPRWAFLMPWLTLYLVELPSLHWLWGFSLWRGGSLGLLLPLVIYVAMGLLVWLFGWIFEPVISALMRRTRTLDYIRRWQFTWAAMIAWGACGFAIPLFLAMSPNAHPGGIYALGATALGLLIGAGIAQGLLQGIASPMKKAELDVPPQKRIRSVMLGTMAMAGMVAMGHIWAQITPQRPGTDPKPNILLVTMDTVNIQRVSAYGYPLDTTPTLKRLANEGAKFTQAYAHVPLTQPSHANIFFGLQPQAIGVYENQRPTPYKLVSLAERFRSLGWFTAGVPATLMMREKYGMHQGFDRWPERTTDHGVQSLQWARLGPMRLLRVVWGGSFDLAQILDDAEFGTARALEAVDYAAHRSWFMWVHYYDPHAPYTLPKQIRAQYYLEAPVTPGFNPDRDGKVDNLENFSYWGLEPLLGACFLQTHKITPVEAATTEIEDLRRVYDAQLRYTDEWLGTLLEELKARGELENTLVVVTADHGEGLFDHGYFGHNFTLHQDEVHVPLIVWWPGKIKPQVIDDPVGLSDLYPTILALVNTSPPPAWDKAPVESKGRSFANALLNGKGKPEEAPVYLQVVTFSRGMVTPEGEKLIFQPVKGQSEYAANPYTGPPWQWYDLLTDPTERTSLVGTDPATLDEATYREFTGRQGAVDRIARDLEGRPVAEINYQGYVRIAIDDAERKALESLGYLTPGGASTAMDQSKCKDPVVQTEARKAELKAEAAAQLAAAELAAAQKAAAETEPQTVPEAAP